MVKAFQVQRSSSVHSRTPARQSHPRRAVTSAPFRQRRQSLTLILMLLLTAPAPCRCLSCAASWSTAAVRPSCLFMHCPAKFTGHPAAVPSTHKWCRHYARYHPACCVHRTWTCQTAPPLRSRSSSGETSVPVPFTYDPSRSLCRIAAPSLAILLTRARISDEPRAHPAVRVTAGRSTHA